MRRAGTRTEGSVAVQRPALLPAPSRRESRLDRAGDQRSFGSMKTTVDLPEDSLAEAMKHSKAKTKTEAVALAVSEFNRRARMAALTKHLGTFKNFMTQADLKRMREDGKVRP